MHLNNQQILNFVQRIKLSAEKKSDYNDQIEDLKDRVKQAINDIPGTKVERIRRAGSWKKGTALRPRGDNPLDIDMVFFIRVDEESDFNSEELRKEIIDVLQKAYPNKNKADFTNEKKTVGIVFKGSGLEVDIVPFIPDKNKNSTYGRQPRKKLNSGDFRTSVDKQLDYISAIKGKCPSFAPAVRMAKWWRNRKELELPSFAIELIFAHLVESRRIQANEGIENALIDFFNYLRPDMDLHIGFPGAIGDMPPGIIPYIADPTNNENNVLEKFILEKKEWNEIMDAANEAFEILSHATCVESKTETEEKWREVFESFTIAEN